MIDLRAVATERPLLAILRNVPLEKTLDYAQAVLEGGVNFFEVALNSIHGLKQITMLRKRLGDRALVGAGTAVTVPLAQAALDAGAQFLLTPSTPVDVLAYCREKDVAILPGVFSPTDVETCLRYGFRTMKLFPAGDLPMGYIKSLQGPFDDTEYVAIGGVGPENLQDFFAAGFIGVGLGSNLLPKRFVEQDDWRGGKEYVAQLVKTIEAVRKECAR